MYPLWCTNRKLSWQTVTDNFVWTTVIFFSFLEKNYSSEVLDLVLAEWVFRRLWKLLDFKTSSIVNTVTALRLCRLRLSDNIKRSCWCPSLWFCSWNLSVEPGADKNALHPIPFLSVNSDPEKITRKLQQFN